MIAAEGPERIEGAWWSEHGGAARDYFRVEDKAGLRFWLFRSGLYRDLVQAPPRRHGSCTGPLRDVVRHTFSFPLPLWERVASAEGIRARTR